MSDDDDYIRIARSLSHLAALLLRAVDQHTERDAAGALQRFWLPPSGLKTQRVHMAGRDAGKLEDLFVDGSGVAASLRALERRGLIARPRTNMQAPYIFAITEAGRIVVEHLYAAEQ